MQSQAQISAGTIKSSVYISPFKKGMAEKLKKAKTIFVLPLEHSIEEYKTVLDEAWTVNEFEVVSVQNFNPMEYVNGNYLIASAVSVILKSGDQLSTKERIVNFIPFLSFYIYDGPTFRKKYKKLSPKARKNRKESLLRQTSQTFIHLYFSPKIEVWQKALLDTDGVVNALYEKGNLYNFGLGMFYNNAKKVNDIIESGKYTDVKSGHIGSELKDLQSETLYIPESSFDQFKRPIGKLPFLEQTEGEGINKMMEAYEGKYLVISDDELNEKILSEEKIYYMKYTRMVNRKILEVIDSSNGSSVFRYNKAGLKINLSKKMISHLNKMVKKQK